MDTALQGHIENGVVVLDQPMPFPDGTAVRVEPIAAKPPPHHMNEAEVTAYVKQMGGDELAAARFVRIAWMRRQGLDPEEIEESLRDEPPTSVAEEMKEIRSADHLDEISVPDAVLGKNAIKYY